MTMEINNTKTEEMMLNFFHRVVKKRDTVIKESLQEKIYYYSDEILKSIKEIRFSSRPKLLELCIDEIEEKANQMYVLGEKLEEPFLIFAIGMGKYGKSTLVNALVGKRVAEVDELPKTWKIDIFEASNSGDLVEIIFRDGSSKKYTRKEAKSYIANEERKREESEFKIDDKFYKLSKELDTIEAKEELREKLTKKELYKSDIVEVHWPCQVDNNSLLNKFRVVDTPGLWQESAEDETQEDLREYYHKADGVLWMLDATTLASQQPKKLLDELDKALDKIGGKVDNVIGILNRIDLVRKNNPENVKRVIKQAKEIFDGYFYDIVPVSAKEAIDGLEQNDYSLYKKSGFSDLRRSIDSYFLRKASRIQSESKLNGLKGYLRDIKEVIIGYKYRLEEDEKKRKKLKKELRKCINQEKEKMKNILEDILKNYKNKVLMNIESYAEKLFDYDESNQDKCERFVRNDIFLEDHITGELNSFHRRYNKSSNLILQKMIREAKFSEFKHINKNSTLITREFAHDYNKKWELNNINMSKDSTLGSISAIVAGGFLLGPVGIVLGLVANSLGLVKWAVVKFKLPKLKKKLRAKLNESINSIRIRVNQDIDRDFVNISKKATKVREESFAALHGPSKDYKKIITKLNQIKFLERARLNLEVDMLELIKKG
ncbi:dynamin family protein [Natroniella acetigena]|uniref:dynamin family protein n=1 Tax=Natroniella acetigena TaxID=52004 RepID=UPI00200AA6EF|nr:dynamin family protein [Natroniella acetigena]MCK8827056.1 dynamin family protein [Natroniella acetigena]